MIDSAQLKRMEAENIACGDAENEWLVRNARRYLALRENEIIIIQAADLDFNPEGYRARYDAAADRLLENES